MPDRIANRVLLIGWDAADWKVISPLLDAGKMPALASLVERGVMGNLATLEPPFSPMLWTSIATGHTADRHGILHFVQPDETGTGIRPVLGTSRTAKALWNVLHQSGMRSNVVGWWPSHPAEPIRGAMVSNFFQTETPPPGTVHPPDLEDVLLDLRVGVKELTGNHLVPFLPDLAEIDQIQDPRPLAVARAISDSASIHAAATYLMETTDWDLTAVYFDAIDHLGHGFMRYHPPQLPGVTDDDFRLYRHVIEAGYRFHDMMLGQLLAQTDDDTAVILLSDHGFYSDHLRPREVPRHVPAGAATEHRPFGVLAMAGPGIRRDQRVNGAGLLNIAPTVLTLLGLPVGADMPGAPLVQAFETPPPFETIPSWDDREGADGSHPEGARADPWSDLEAVHQLVGLGYIDLETSDADAAAAAARDASFNLARVYDSTGRVEQSIPHYESVLEAESPHRDYYALALARAYLAVGRIEDALRVVEVYDGDTRFPIEVALLRSDLEVARGSHDAALDILASLPTSSAGSPEVHLRRADLYMRLGRIEDASDAFEAVLALDPDNARAYNGRAVVAIQRKDYQAAADAALEAVARLYHFPLAHFHYGVAMLRLGWADRAEDAFTVCLQQRPGFALAHRWLARIYKDYLRQPHDAKRHWRAYEQLSTSSDEE
ncbi:alkaline phosphatase family protein [Rubrivirga sp.]|uniref:alkaline phosphatase family protein n=1 Tax=Rubrivirga sp. TaxID=1885344 RepID=UPI003C7799A9